MIWLQGITISLVSLYSKYVRNLLIWLLDLFYICPEYIKIFPIYFLWCIDTKVDTSSSSKAAPPAGTSPPRSRLGLLEKSLSGSDDHLIDRPVRLQRNNLQHRWSWSKTPYIQPDWTTKHKLDQFLFPPLLGGSGWLGSHFLDNNQCFVWHCLRRLDNDGDQRACSSWKK